MSLAIFGAVVGAISLALAPVFISSSAFGIQGHRPPHTFGIRVYPGFGLAAHNKHLGGNIPSVAGWDPNGKYLGRDHKHGHHIEAGGFRDMIVHTHGTNVRPEYLAVVAQRKDAICLAGLAITYADTDKPDLILGDVFAMCGAPWYQSFSKLPGTDHAPLCMWMGPESKKRPIEGTNGDNRVPPKGISLRLPDFAGTVVNDAVIAQRNEKSWLACDHTARLQGYYDNMSGHFQIPIFKNRPLPKQENETDFEDTFLDQPWEMSDPLHRDIWKRNETDEGMRVFGATCEHLIDDCSGDSDEEGISGWDDFDAGMKLATDFLETGLTPAPDSDDEEAAATWDRILRDTLVKGEQTAEHLCSSETSMGPDWYSQKEHHYCHMATKTLLPGCSAVVTEDCFDAERHEIRHKVCPPGRKCARAAAHIPVKQYKNVVDERDQDSDEAGPGW